MKKFFKILFFLFCLIFTNVYPEQKIENVKTKTLDINKKISLSKLSAQQKYYLQNKWDFVEKKLVEKLEKNLRGKVVLGSFLLSILTGTSVGFSSRLLGVKADDAFVAGILTGTIMLPIFVYLIAKGTKIETIKSFMKKYNPDMSVDFPNNTRLYTPEELRGFFDELYNKYPTKGDSYLERQGGKITELIRKKTRIILETNESNLGQKIVAKGLGKVASKTVGAFLKDKIKGK